MSPIETILCSNITFSQSITTFLVVVVAVEQDQTFAAKEGVCERETMLGRISSPRSCYCCIQFGEESASAAYVYTGGGGGWIVAAAVAAIIKF